MGLLDDIMTDLGSDLVALFSDASILTVEHAGVYDPRTGVETPNEVSKSVRAVPLPAQSRNEIGPQSAKTRAEMVFLVAQKDLTAQSLSPIEGMTITFQGRKFILVADEPIYSGDQIAVVKLYVNRV